MKTENRRADEKKKALQKKKESSPYAYQPPKGPSASRQNGS
jgi:hypothetical protein